MRNLSLRRVYDPLRDVYILNYEGVKLYHIMNVLFVVVTTPMYTTPKNAFFI